VSRRVVVLGVGADGPEGLAPGGRELIAAADFLAGGRRHLAMVGSTGAEAFAIADNLDALAERLARRGEDERCVVLASGDPLFFGVGEFLGRRLGPDALDVRPAVSSMALAFARAGVSWHDAAVASVHGRPLGATLRPLLGRPKIGLFTRDGRSPAEVAAFFLAHGLADYRATVAERLGAADERVVTAPISALAGAAFADLNVLILLRDPPPVGFAPRPSAPDPPPPGLPDSAFAQPESGPVLLTHADIRAVTLARFRDLPGGPIWDVGAGLGGVSVELARAFPAREVIAFERSADRAAYLAENRLRFAAYNLRVVVGEAPDCLPDEPPAGVFLGGSGGRLEGALDRILGRLRPGGVFVANFVGLENLAACLGRLRASGWPTEVAQVQVSPSAPLAGLTTFVPIRPVWVLRAVRRSGEAGG
jgi:precorrin-6Y C5,15-methyltransferase (decarboxylating)